MYMRKARRLPFSKAQPTNSGERAVRDVPNTIRPKGTIKST